MAKVKITGHASGTGVITVTAPNTSTDRTITLPDSTGTILDENSSLPAANITGTLPAISGASLTGVNAVNSGRKNLIVNGGMKVWQRATAATAAAGGYETIDRWQFFNGSDGAYTSEKHGMSLAEINTTGHSQAIALNVTTADTAIAAAQYAYFSYIIEAQDLQHLQWGTAAAKDITLSFWVKSKIAGTYYVTLRKKDGTAYYINRAYTVDVADTWEYKTITITPTAGSTSLITGAGGIINNDTGDGLKIYFGLSWGTNYHTTTDTWATPVDYSASDQVNWMSSTSNDFYLTGVQLEVGSVATDFEHRSYGEELALCQRYYQILAEGAGNGIGIGAFYNTATMYLGPMTFNTMRATPTFAQTTGTNYYKYYVAGTGNNFSAFTTSWNIGTNTLLLELGSQSKTAGHAAMCKTNDSSSRLSLDAEL